MVKSSYAGPARFAVFASDWLVNIALLAEVLIEFYHFRFVLQVPHPFYFVYEQKVVKIFFGVHWRLECYP